MEDTIYLICDRKNVKGMRKTLPRWKRGEVIVKLKVEVDPDCFGSPTIEKHVFVEDWKEGIDLEDVQFEKNIITEEEAEIIKEKRLEKMQRILEEQGYFVSKKEEDDDEVGKRVE
jgi:hypothetical protein